MKVLLVEDEEVTASYLRRGLGEEGYVVDLARHGGLADEAVWLQHYDLILLDVMLPQRDGFSLCREWRARGLKTPILMLTGRDTVRDRVSGLDAGADDYLVKPFAFEELLARMRALLRRRSEPEFEGSIEVGVLVVVPQRKEARLRGKPVDLTAKEFQLLEVLARHVGQVVSRTVLWESVWESHHEPNSNVVDVYIGYLRKKLGDQAGLVKTVRGSGYCLEESEPSVG